MAASRYSLEITLPSGHADDITALQLSPDGKFLASGSGDGVILVFFGTSSWKPVKRFINACVPLRSVRSTFMYCVSYCYCLYNLQILCLCETHKPLREH